MRVVNETNARPITRPMMCPIPVMIARNAAFARERESRRVKKETETKSGNEKESVRTRSCKDENMELKPNDDDEEGLGKEMVGIDGALVSSLSKFQSFLRAGVRAFTSTRDFIRGFVFTCEIFGCAW